MTEKAQEDSKAFLLMEYEQIARAHFEDQKRKTDLLRYYIATITLPVSLIAAALSFASGKSASNVTSTMLFPILQAPISNIVGVVIIIIAVAGFLLMDMINDVRFEALSYARTVNLIRRWFKDRDQHLEDYLALPTTDSIPKFYELRRLVMGEVGLAALLDSLLISLGVWFILQNANLGFWIVLILVAVAGLFFIIHLGLYAYRAKARDLRWRQKAPDPEQKTKDMESRLT